MYNYVVKSINLVDEQETLMHLAAPVDMLLTVKDVAELLCIRPRTAWRWARQGKIPRPMKLSRRAVRWRASEMQTYLDRVAAESKLAVE
jgi:prophage regulatory protein